MRSTPDECFARFRAGGEPAALGALFDLTAPELFKVALHLSGDRTRAEDLVQGTFLTAIEDAAAFDPDQRVLPWLLGILANRARYQQRGEARQIAAERLVRSPVEDPALAAERREFAEALARGITQVPEVYRQVLVLHLQHGLSAKDIGAALGRPAGTVRTQVVRGLDLLRLALPAGFGAAVVCAVAPAQVLGRMRQVVLAELGARTGVGVVAGAAGGLWFMNKLVVAGVVVMLAAGTWWCWPRLGADGTVSVASDRAAASQPGAFLRDRPAAAPSVAESAPVRREPVAGARMPPPAPGATALLVRVRFAVDGSAAAGVLVECAPPWSETSDLLAQTRTTDEAGLVRFSGMPPGKVTVRADRGGSTGAELVAGEGTELELEIPRGHDVTGVVVDQQGEPVRGAQVWLSRDAVVLLGQGRCVARSDEHGRFHLRSVEPKRLLSAIHDGFLPARKVALPAEPRQAVEVRVQLGAALTSTLAGQVSGPDGVALPDASVVLGFTYGSRSMGGNNAPEFWLRTDHAGRFSCASLPGVQDSFPVWVRAPGTAIWYAKVGLRPDRPMWLDVQLQRGATVRGTLRDTAGQPVTGVNVEVFQDAIEPPPNVAPMGPGWARPRAAPDAAGRFAIANILPGRVILRAESQAGRAEVLWELADGEERTWDAVLGNGLAIVGEARDEAGAPLPDWDVWAQGGKGVREPPRVKTDAAGRFRIERCTAVPYRLSLREPKTAMNQASWTLLGVMPAADPLLVVVPAARRASAFVTGTLLDAEGVPLTAKDTYVSGNLRCADATNASGGGSVQLEHGRFRLGPMVPGRYEFAASIDDGAISVGLGACELAPGEVKDLGVLRLQKPGFVRVTVRDHLGQPMSVGVVVKSEDNLFGDVVFTGKGDSRSKPKQPGRYVVQPFSHEVVPFHREVEVRAGEEVLVEVRVEPGVRRRVRMPALAQDEMALQIAWRDARGDLVARSTGGWSSHGGPVEYSQKFMPGRYTVEVSDHFGHSASRMFTVDDRPESDEVIELAVPDSLRKR